MPHLQVIEFKKDERKAYRNVLHYVAREDKCRGGIYGMTNVYNDTSRNSYENVEEMDRFIREHHGRNGGRRMLHVIVRFSPSESSFLDRKKVLQIAYLVAMKEFPNNVCYFAVHDHSTYLGTDLTYYHIDMMILLTDIYTGNIFSCGKKGWYRIVCDISDYLRNIMPKKCVTRAYVFYGRNESNRGRTFEEEEMA